MLPQGAVTLWRAGRCSKAKPCWPNASHIHSSDIPAAWGMGTSRANTMSAFPRNYFWSASGLWTEIARTNTAAALSCPCRLRRMHRVTPACRVQLLVSCSSRSSWLVHGAHTLCSTSSRSILAPSQITDSDQCWMPACSCGHTNLNLVAVAIAVASKFLTCCSAHT